VSGFGFMVSGLVERECTGSGEVVVVTDGDGAAARRM